MSGNKISPVALGLSIGCFWGGSIFIMGVIAHYFSYGIEFVTSMKSIYVGYEPSLIGSVVGGLVGFIDAFIAGALVSVLYNFFSGHCCSSRGKCK